MRSTIADDGYAVRTSIAVRLRSNEPWLFSSFVNHP
jgi:hypothetical protein